MARTERRDKQITERRSSLQELLKWLPTGSTLGLRGTSPARWHEEVVSGIVKSNTTLWTAPPRVTGTTRQSCPVVIVLYGGNRSLTVPPISQIIIPPIFDCMAARVFFAIIFGPLKYICGSL